MITSGRGIAFIIVVGCSLAGLACSSSMRNTDPRSSLPMALRDFHSHLVWGRYGEAAGYLPASQQSQFLGAQEQIGDELRYTEYEIGTVDTSPTEGEAIVTVTLRWYRVPYYTIESTRVREVWTYDEESEYWWLTERTSAELSAAN